MQAHFDDGWITFTAAKRAEKQYCSLIQNPDFLIEAKKFNINDDRVDSFYVGILDCPATIDLQNVAQLVLILSHGNARVESGFSVNNDMLIPNMLEETIVAQRLVYEGVYKDGCGNKCRNYPRNGEDGDPTPDTQNQVVEKIKLWI